jgi:hypothetical protein
MLSLMIPLDKMPVASSKQVATPDIFFIPLW